MMKEKKTEKFLKLVDILEKLRGEKGCHWDKKQNHQKPFQKFVYIL